MSAKMCRESNKTEYLGALIVLYFAFNFFVAPSLPPSTMSVLTMSAFSVFIEWTHPPSDSWNGNIKGYKVKLKSEDGAYTKSIDVNGGGVYANVDALTPDTLYIVDVCAFTSAGVGPCLRSFNRTFVSRKFNSFS